MPEKPVQRRLAAILAADVAGFARLVERDEEGTIQRLAECYDREITPQITQHGGRVVKFMGDGILAEFTSVVEAVRCAIEIQLAFAHDANDQAVAQRIEFRIGVNLGDVLIDNDDIHGDGVNVAARLEQLSPNGGICISGGVHEQVRNRVNVEFDDLGFQQLKNIDRPVRVWQWANSKAPATQEAQTSENLDPKPSIAVLPFDNMSGDPKQEYFSDGITEDLITALSHVRGFNTIARNSSFTYKGQSISVRDIGKQLGIRYLIEGSVRRSGNRVRISVQLIDAETDQHLWAESYDRDLDDVFLVQDEIVLNVVGAIEPELAEAESARARSKPPDSLDAWECYNRALWHLFKITKEDFATGMGLLQKAIEIDPEFARAYGTIASALHALVLLGHVEDPENIIAKAVAAGRHGVALDNKDTSTHFGLGRAYTLSGDLEGAILHFEAALEINPSSAQAHHGIVTPLTLLGRHEEAIQHADQALRFSPRDPMIWTFLQVKAHALYHLRRYEYAIEVAKKSTHQPGAGFWCWTCLAAAQAQQERVEPAKTAMASAMKRNPQLSVTFISKALPWQVTEDLEHYLEGLRKAGLPE